MKEPPVSLAELNGLSMSQEEAETFLYRVAAVIYRGRALLGPDR